MKKNIPWIIVLTVSITFFCYTGYARSAPPEAAAPKVEKADAGHLLDITFDRIKGKERLTFHISKQTGASAEALAGNAVLIKMANIFVPQELRSTLGEGKLSNVINVKPAQKAIEGQQWAFITVALRERVPYSVSQAGQNVVVDFNISSIEATLPAPEQKQYDAAKETPKQEEKSAWARVDKGKEATKYMGRKISLDFQDAPIKAVLRLLAEAGEVTIVAGEDVKGAMTVHMHKVPWDQALDTILDVQGLAKKQMGDVISVVTYERMKKDEADRRQGEEDRQKAEALAKKAEQDRLEEKGKLRQISIEAKIVEATDDFIRTLGVTWGGTSYGRMGDYRSAIMAGTNTSQARGVTWPYPPELGYVNAGDGKPFRAMSLNYPASVAAPTFGLVIGGTNAILEAQLQALETTGQGKIISSPKVTTMDNVKATIKQGEEIPYITIDKDGNRSITFKEAVLKLDVKPKITPEETISMEIKATNDYADYIKGSTYLSGNPPINKSEVESKIIVQDGDTIVIGGILRSTEQTAVSGVPWLSKIPILGWLFKTENITKQRKQLMVFITPKVIKTEEAGGEKPERLKGG